MLEVLQKYQPISIGDLQKYNFNNRRDKRYIVSRERALSILDEMSREYKLLEVEGDSVINYETSYYDTKDFDLYCKKWNRENYNIRLRSYSTSRLSFIDIKHTISDSIVSKYHNEYTSDQRFQKMVEESTPYLFSTLEEKIAIHFNRFTFVDCKNQEKVTIDIDLGFTTKDKFESIPDLAIIEVKSCKRFYTSKFRPIIGRYNLSTSNCSKYCLGVSLMYPEVVMENRICKLIPARERLLAL